MLDLMMLHKEHSQQSTGKTENSDHVSALGFELEPTELQVGVPLSQNQKFQC